MLGVAAKINDRISPLTSVRGEFMFITNIFTIILRKRN